MTCPIDLSKLPYGKLYLIPLATSTAALLFMLVAAYSCKFVRVTQGDLLSPFFVGIWKAEGGIAAGQGYLDNTNECIAWTDTPYYADGGVRAAKFFTIFTTFWGTLLWILVWLGAFQVVSHLMRNLLLMGACSCAVLNVMFFCVFASDVCDAPDLTCRMGAAAYLALTATVLWMTTAALAYAFTTTSSRTDNESNNNTTSRDLVTVATTHSTPTVPTGRVPRSQPYRHGAHRTAVPQSLQQTTIKEGSDEIMEQRYSGGSGSRRDQTGSSSSSSPSVSPRPEDPWHERSRSSPVDLDEEVGMDDMPPVGSPLVSITEDERGNLIRTTITRTVDSQGRTIIDRTSQIIEDKDKSITAEV